jgi:hypothetical protein
MMGFPVVSPPANFRCASGAKRKMWVMTRLPSAARIRGLKKAPQIRRHSDSVVAFNFQTP